MGRPPSNGAPSFRFSPVEVAQMEALLKKHEGQVPPRDLLVALAQRFSNSSERAGKTLVQMKQVWNWFQNRRYALRAKSTESPGKPSSSPVTRDDVTPVRNVPSVPRQMAVSSGPHVVRNTSEAPTMEFEAKSARDGAWYDVQLFLSHRYLDTANPEVLVRFAGFGPEEDEWVNILKHVRQRSLPCEASECIVVLPGDLILCFQEGKEQALYFDAHVLDAQRRRHDVRGCRCRFLVRYDHDQSEEIVPLRKICRRPETDYRLQQLHAANEAAPATSTSTSAPMNRPTPVAEFTSTSTSGLTIPNPRNPSIAISPLPPVPIASAGPSVRPPAPTLAPISAPAAPLVGVPVPSPVAPPVTTLFPTSVPAPSGTASSVPFSSGPFTVSAPISRQLNVVSETPAPVPDPKKAESCNPAQITVPSPEKAGSDNPMQIAVPNPSKVESDNPALILVPDQNKPESNNPAQNPVPDMKKVDSDHSTQIPVPDQKNAENSNPAPIPVPDEKKVERDNPGQISILEQMEVESDIPSQIAVPDQKNIESNNPVQNSVPERMEVDSDIPSQTSVPERMEVESDSPAQILVPDQKNIESDNPAQISVPELMEVESDSPAQILVPELKKVESDNQTQIPVPSLKKVEIDNPIQIQVHALEKVESDSPAQGPIHVPEHVEIDNLAQIQVPAAQENIERENPAQIPVPAPKADIDNLAQIPVPAPEKVENDHPPHVSVPEPDKSESVISASEANLEKAESDILGSAPDPNRFQSLNLGTSNSQSGAEPNATNFDVITQIQEAKLGENNKPKTVSSTGISVSEAQPSGEANYGTEIGSTVSGDPESTVPTKEMNE
ncbi:hypothetical protein KSS87_008264 [Heliosperma pusillum]|nr:hypothetical protein KSS87_008264 [Heliosperma pusillum]